MHGSLYEPVCTILNSHGLPHSKQGRHMPTVEYNRHHESWALDWTMDWITDWTIEWIIGIVRGNYQHTSALALPLTWGGVLIRNHRFPFWKHEIWKTNQFFNFSLPM